MESLQSQADALATSLATAPEGATVSIPDHLIASLFFNPEWSSLETATVDGLQATGRIGLFTDPTVSERMAVWDGRRAAVLLRQQELRDHFNDRVLPYLSEEIDIGPFVANRDPYREGGAGADEFPWMGLQGETGLRNTRLLRNLVQQRVLFVGATRIQVDLATRALQALLDTVQPSR